MASPNPGLLAALLKTGRLTGVLRWKVTVTPEVVATESGLSKFSGYFVDTSGATTIKDFLGLVGNQLGIIDLNLSNFESKLKTLTVTESGGFIAWSGWQELVKENIDDAIVAVELFQTVCANWPGVVLAVDPVGKFAGLDELVAA